MMRIPRYRMTVVPVQTAHSAYSIKIADGLMAQLGSEARALFPQRSTCALVTDSTVGPLYAEAVSASLREAGFTPHLITVPAGEASKSYPQLEHITSAMCRAGMDRRSFLIALGGGVVGDLAGFAASIFYRGIPFIQVPTTIVSVVDSSVGGKTGINSAEGKNLIGSFHQPSLVLIDPMALSTLPPREYHEGYAEVIKHACIKDAAMFPELLSIAAQGHRHGLAPLIAKNVAIKAAIVGADEFETTGLRALLNFGHTIGHGIEASAGYGTLLHGEAISLGMRAALHLSERFASLSPSVTQSVLHLLRAFGLPLVLAPAITTADILSKLSRDKKFEKGAIRFVLLRSLGDAYVSSEVTPQAIEEAIAALRLPLP